MELQKMPSSHTGHMFGPSIFLLKLTHSLLAEMSRMGLFHINNGETEFGKQDAWNYYGIII